MRVSVLYPGSLYARKLLVSTQPDNGFEKCGEGLGEYKDLNILTTHRAWKTDTSSQNVFWSKHQIRVPGKPWTFPTCGSVTVFYH